ncbi:MAG: ABC transporter permease subunit [Deltaproteobacteria bacterium]|nr:ABC transporter permease subunit [Deltaproteobacteria bacterium]
MTGALALCRREFNAYFDSPVAYVFIISFLAVTYWFFFRGFFVGNQIQMRGFFFFLPWVFLIFIPAVTMRLWAEEKKMGTVEILLTLPVREYELVLGKFMAGFLFVFASVFFSFSLPLTLGCLGKLDWGPVVGGYLGTCFLGGAYLSIGLFLSNFTKNQIVAFILTILLSFILFILGEDIVLANLPEFWAPFFSFMGLGRHFNSIQRGIIDSRDIIYYLSVTGFFLFMNVIYVTRRR